MFGCLFYARGEVTKVDKRDGGGVIISSRALERCDGNSVGPNSGIKTRVLVLDRVS